VLINTTRLDLWQWYGDACAACGRRFRVDDMCVDVGRVGLDQHPLRACPACVPAIEQRPAWPMVGAA
jgi:hypothetical protein